MFFLTACQTSSRVISEQSHFSDGMRKSYETYLKYKNYKASTNVPHTGSALAYNPQNGTAVAMYPGSRNQIPFWAQDAALKECGESCYLYAIDEKLVWNEQIGSNRHTLLSIETMPAIFSLTKDQETDFLDYKSIVTFNSTDEVYAFAVSHDGASGFGIGDRVSLAEIEAKKACEMLSFGSPCYIYAINDEIVGDYDAISDVYLSNKLTPKKKSTPIQPVQHYNQELFKLTTSQYKKYGDYLARVARKQNNEHFAFAVSDNGYVATAKNNSDLIAQLDAIKSCKEIAQQGECYLYAANRKVVHKTR